MEATTPRESSPPKKLQEKVLGKLQTPVIGRLSWESVIVLLIAATSLVLLVLSAKLPWIPREGDPFNCWQGYMQNLRESGLASALKNADTIGRYPGYPTFLLILSQLGATDFFQALEVSRILSSLLSFLSMFLLFRQLKLRANVALIVTAVIHLIPSYIEIAALNTQDSLKAPFFMFAALFLLKLADQSNPQLPNKVGNRAALFGRHFSFRNYLLFSVASIALASLRSVDLLPLFALVAAINLHFIKTFRQFFVRSSLYVAPSITFVVLLHIYAHQVVGHWGLSSSGSGPQFWVGLVSDELNNQYPQGGWDRLVHLGIWTMRNVLNKLRYFIEDFFLQTNVLRIVNAGIDKTLDDSFRPAVLYVTASIGMGLTLLCMAVDLKVKNISTAFLWATLAAGIFYIFGLNHYEPRYWLLVFLPLILAIFLRFSKSDFSTLGFVLVALALLPLNLSHHHTALEQNEASIKQTESWANAIRENCLAGKRIFQVPYFFFAYTPFRYFVNKNCPGSLVIHDQPNPSFTPEIVNEAVKFDSYWLKQAGSL